MQVAAIDQLLSWLCIVYTTILSTRCQIASSTQSAAMSPPDPPFSFTPSSLQAQQDVPPPGVIGYGQAQQFADGASGMSLFCLKISLFAEFAGRVVWDSLEWL